MMPKRTLKAVFGGTFDPPHLGHTRLAEAVLREKLVDKIIFVPACIPPHKTEREISDFEHRFRMLELAVKDFSGFEISRIEAEDIKSPSYTLKTMDKLRERFPDSEFKLLVGGDSLGMLYSWHRAGELVEKYAFITYPRPGETPTIEELLRHWDRRTAEKLLDSIERLPCFDISSTEIRRKIKLNQDVSDLLNPEVEAYIYRNKLY